MDLGPRLMVFVRLCLLSSNCSTSADRDSSLCLYSEKPQFSVFSQSDIKEQHATFQITFLAFFLLLFIMCLAPVMDWGIITPGTMQTEQGCQCLEELALYIA